MSDEKINRLINKSEVARILGVHQTYVSKIMLGQRKGKKALQKKREIETIIQKTLKAAA
ncbi:MAG: hypothetical protein AB1394_03715 [Bacteroidota bacterium]